MSRTSAKRVPHPKGKISINKHFAIRLPVQIKKGAKPVGWPAGEKFTDLLDDEYARTFPIEEVSDSDKERSTYLVNGRFWHPEDLRIPYV